MSECEFSTITTLENNINDKKITRFIMKFMALSFLADTATNRANGSSSTCGSFFCWVYDLIRQCPLAPPTPKELTATMPPSHGVTFSTTYII